MKRFLLVASLVVVAAAISAGLCAAAEGQELYARCQGCHGPDASKLIKSKAEADLMKALNGYKAKDYGGEKKVMMENQVKNLSEDDIKVLAKYMSKL